MSRITERELILPTLYLIRQQPDINTSELIEKLAEIFHPTGEDAEILHGRNDSKFSQIVRNLVAHHTLEEGRLGFAVYERRGGNGHFRITREGEDHLQNNLVAVEYLLGSHFQYTELVAGASTIQTAVEHRRRILPPINENTPILEGGRHQISAVVTDRSSLLRNAAITFYTRPDGHLLCQACDFDFWVVYGDIGRGFMEVHHKTPLFQYEDEDTNLFLRDAILGVAPLCSNCHRMIHHNRNQVMEVQELRAIILARRS